MCIRDRKSLLLNLCGFLLAGFGNSIHVSGALPKSRLAYQHIRAYLLANYRTATLEGTARHMFFSQRHLGRIVKENCGKSFTGLLTEIRLEAACGLLHDTALSVSEVGWACGFRDPGYFIRVFRRSFGMTPAAYRARPA